jgi:hypothetical protein
MVAVVVVVAVVVAAVGTPLAQRSQPTPGYLRS